MTLLRHQFEAYKYYLKSAQRGLLNGGIELADIWIHGITGRVARRPADAVLYVTHNNLM